MTAHETTFAATWLENKLAGGPQLSAEIKRAASVDGIALRTLWRAKRQLGVEARKRTTADGPWFWKLPAKQKSK